MSEIRKNIITGDDVVIAIERGKRPHDFKHDEEEVKSGGYCPFCYGNEGDTPEEIIAVSDDSERKPNTSGWRIRVVPNKFAAFDIEEELKKSKDVFYEKMTGVGVAEVVIESNEHNSTFGTHDYEHIKDIIRVLKERYNNLVQDERLKYVQIFKNFGGIAGASLEHPHWQIMATPLVPSVIKKELRGAKKYYKEEGSCVYCDMLDYELELDKRIITRENDFVAFNPYASRYPFETWVMPKEHNSNFGSITEEEIGDLSYVLQMIIRKFEVGFNNPPFNIILHTAPCNVDCKEEYHWHIEILPRLSIAAGFELGTGSFINPTPPKLAAQSLKEIK